MKQASLEDWQAIGAQAKQVRKELLSLLNQTSGKLPVSINNSLIKSIQCLDRFRSNAEERMLQSGVSDDLKTFYGG